MESGEPINRLIDIKSLAGARAVGLAGFFLHYLKIKGLMRITERSELGSEQLRQLYLLLGAQARASDYWI